MMQQTVPIRRYAVLYEWARWENGVGSSYLSDQHTIVLNAYTAEDAITQGTLQAKAQWVVGQIRVLGVWPTEQEA